MMLFVTLAAAHFTAAAPTADWIKRADTPSRELGWLGYTSLLIRVTIDPTGKVVNCGVEESSGRPAIDTYTCQLTVNRARFLPAASDDGRPTYGVYRRQVIWKLSTYKLPPFDDLTLSVNQLPQGAKSPALLELAFAADEHGRISSCRSGDGQQSAELVTLACSQMKAQFTAIPAKDANGKTVPSVQNGFVVVEKRK